MLLDDVANIKRRRCVLLLFLRYYVHKNIPHCSIGSCLPNNKMDIKLFGGLLGVRATKCCRCLSCNRYVPLAVCP